MRTRFFNILLAVLLLAAPALAAEPSPELDFKGIYVFGLVGLPFGKMGIEIEQAEKHYDITADISMTGLVKWFAPHSSHSTASGSGGSFSYPNREYETSYKTKKKKRYVKLLHKGGALVEEKLVPPENRVSRPEVPMEMKKNAPDPMTFILQLRQELMKFLLPLREGSFSLDVYDGRRLTRTDVTILGRRTLRYEGKKLPVIAVSLRRKQVAGFTKSEMQKFDPNEPPLIVYFSNDKRFIPVRLEANAWFGLLYAELAKECRTGESCLLGIRE